MMEGGNDLKNKRYDRQIRIWGAHGQHALERASVCLLNASATGTETLKNLVLAGINSFTIVDAAEVEERDLGNNFFLERRHLGLCRAQCAADLLKELNESVTGSFINDSPATLIQSNPALFKQFTLIIASQMPEGELVQLDSICQDLGTRLIIVRSYGLAGYLRICGKEHCVVETKPSDIVHDLRIANPWPELRQWAMAFDLDTADDILHKHIPYVALLIQAAERWKAEHNGQPPGSSVEVREFKQLVAGMQRSVEGVPLDEDNFSEALQAAHKAWRVRETPSSLMKILQDRAAVSLTRDSNAFWVMAAALRQYLEREGKGQLPLDGAMPDMTATTELYLQLQRLFQDRTNADLSVVEMHLHAILEGLGRSPDEISRSELRAFCRNAQHLTVVRWRPLAEEYAGKGNQMVEELRQVLADDSLSSNATLYLLLRVAVRLQAMHGRVPGHDNDQVEEDVAAVKQAATALLSEMGISDRTVSDELVAEIVRCAAAELHCVASILGGVAAQEAVKLITGQFIPLDGTLIVNCMSCTTSVFKL